MQSAIVEHKVLIVDDNPNNRQLIAAILDDEGMSYDEAENGKTALHLIGKNKYWLALIDLLMPGIDGFATIRKIREAELTFPIIAVSAISFKQDRQAAFEAGCDYFIAKPVDVPLLIEVVNDYKAEFLKKLEISGEASTSGGTSASLDHRDRKPGHLKTSQIALVEANPTRRDEFAAFLRDQGCRVSPFNNGADAWKYVTEADGKPDVIISNIHMPEIDGLGLLGMIKRAYPSIHFFLYSPQFDTETVKLATEQEVDGLVAMYQFKEVIIDLLDSEIDDQGSKGYHHIIKEAIRQVGQAHENLICFGCDPACRLCDIAFSQLHTVGGDIASCRRFNLDGRCGIILLDIAGHNVVSSYLSAVVWGIISSNWSHYQNPWDLAKFLNQELFRMGYLNSHVCLTAALIDRHRSTLSIVTAGNPGGILLEPEKHDEFRFTPLPGGGMVVGLLRDHDRMIQQQFTIPKDGAIIFHSDGLERTWIQDTIQKLLPPPGNRALALSAQSILERILSEHRQQDDMMIVRLDFDALEPEAENHLMIQSGFSEVDSACDWLENILSGNILPEGYDLYNIMLCTREALLNAVEHGNRRNHGAFVDLTVFPEESHLKIRVSDEGGGFDLNEKIKEARKVDGLQVGMRGLPLIAALTDNLDVFGGSVTMTFAINEKDISQLKSSEQR